MELYLTYIMYYGVAAIAFLFINAFIAGYVSKPLTKEDFRDSLLWPIYVSMILGIIAKPIIRIIINQFVKLGKYIKRIKENKRVQKAKAEKTETQSHKGK